MDAQERRRVRRGSKQMDWKTQNPLKVGISAAPHPQTLLKLNRKSINRVTKALGMDNEYILQIQKNADRYQRLRQQQQTQNTRIYQAPPQNASGLPDANGKEKRYGKSIPLI